MSILPTANRTKKKESRCSRKESRCLGVSTYLARVIDADVCPVLAFFVEDDTILGEGRVELLALLGTQEHA